MQTRPTPCIGGRRGVGKPDHGGHQLSFIGRVDKYPPVAHYRASASISGPDGSDSAGPCLHVDDW